MPHEENRCDDLQQRVAAALQHAGISFDSEVNVEGLQANFVAYGPNGQIVIIEAKSWPPTRQNLDRAAEQAVLYCKVAKASRAFVVLDRIERKQPYPNVLSVEELPDAIALAFASPVPASQLVHEFHPHERMIFAAMPFSSEYDDVFFIAMSHAAKSVNAACKRVDHEDFLGDIVDEIKRLIRDSIAVIADLSESKANVLYEVGYAHALERPTIHISSTPLSELPFDVRNWNTPAYCKGQTFVFKDQLSQRLKTVLGNHPV